MRTNIVIDDELLREATRYAKEKTKRGVIEEALLTFVEIKAEERRRTTYKERLKNLDERLAGLTLRERPLDILRQDRQRR
ncbi:MAG: type II toxin-antitoxin system VapB family antitoxin [Planctomycetes bacterium]|nr:type II toxin-antitoxin system VapB family antitoxin [Planctomycetota bacterium]